ncbi:MAG: type II secretion system F family protein [Polyangiaceae bacterium]
MTSRIFGSIPIGIVAILALSLAIGVATYHLASNDDSIVYRVWVRYLSYLENRLRCMFIRGASIKIAIGQGMVSALVLAFALYTGEMSYCLGLVAVAFGPNLYIDRMLRTRTREIERKLDGFVVTFVNSLKATPSIGNALAYTQPLVAPPLSDELALVLKEIRVGTSLEQALLNMSTRVRSAELDAVLASILIGRQVGGNLPRILSTTAETLREMARLQGVVRAKTAEGKVQLFVVALAPLFLIGGFNLLNPGYFQPLLHHPVGIGVSVLSVVLWCVALFMARRIVSVSL